MGPSGKISLLLAAISILHGPILHSATPKEPVDRLLAVVDDDPILESQLDQVIGIEDGRIVDRRQAASYNDSISV